MTVSALIENGDVSGVARKPGQVGEIISATAVGVASVTSNVNVQVANVPLTAGKWRLSACVISNRNGATIAAGNQNMKYSLTTTTAADGTVRGKDFFPVNGALPIDYSDFTLPVVGYTVDISSPTTFYLNAANKYTAGTPTWDGYLEAVRIP